MSETLTAGPELDVEIGRIVGTFIGDSSWITNAMDEEDREAFYEFHFSFSSDIGHAILAASKSALFDSHAIGRNSDGWYLLEPCEPIRYVVEGLPSASLAICAAILHLKGRT